MMMPKPIERDKGNFNVPIQFSYSAISIMAGYPAYANDNKANK